MTGPVVSVVVPAYGRPDRLREALDSVAAQTFDDLAVVVVDDCSPTPIAEAIEGFLANYSRPIEVIRHEENRGASAARNTGIHHATGEFVAFLDDDDRWEERKLQRQVERFRSAGDDVGVVYTGMRMVDGSDRTLRTQVATESGDVTRTLLCRNFVGSFSVVMVRAAAIDDAGSLDERFPAWQDLEWYVRLSRNWTFEPVAEPLVRILQERSHDQISDDFETIANESYELFVEKYRPLAASYGRRFERKMLGWAAFRVGAYNALRTGRYDEARRYLLTAVRRYPVEPAFWLYLLVALGGRPAYTLGRRLKRTIAN